MKEKLILELAEALEIEAEDINLVDNFREYDAYDSLTELSVLAMLDSEFGIEIEMEEYKNYKTVGELLNLVIEKSSK